jgi:hypothetical protein
MPSPLLRSTMVATLLQVGMVVGGHFTPQIARLFAVGGMSISAVGGILFGLWTSGTPAAATTAKGGAVAGGLSALVGIAVSFLLGDVPARTLAIGTTASVVAGILGGFVGRAVSGSAPA